MNVNQLVCVCTVYTNTHVLAHMYIQLYVHVCTQLRSYVEMIHTYVRTFICSYRVGWGVEGCTHINMHVHTYVRMYMRTIRSSGEHTCTYRGTLVLTNVHTYIFIVRIYQKQWEIDTHVRTHTCVHAGQGRATTHESISCLFIPLSNIPDMPD